MSDEKDPFSRDGGHEAISFAIRTDEGLRSVPVGTKLGGTVVEKPKKVHARNFNTKQPDYWDDEKTQPKMTVVTVLDCPDGERRSLWAPIPSAMFGAICDAIAANGGNPIDIGDKLYAELTGFKKNEDKDKASQKLYKAHLSRGAGAFAGGSAEVSVIPAQQTTSAAPPPPPPPPPPAAAAPPPPPPPPAAEPKTPEGHTLAQLISSGWSREQAIGAYPVLAGPGASGGDKVDELSEADRQLLGL